MCHSTMESSLLAKIAETFCRLQDGGAGDSNLHIMVGNWIFRSSRDASDLQIPFFLCNLHTEGVFFNHVSYGTFFHHTFTFCCGTGKSISLRYFWMMFLDIGVKFWLYYCRAVEDNKNLRKCKSDFALEEFRSIQPKKRCFWLSKIVVL